MTRDTRALHSEAETSPPDGHHTQVRDFLSNNHEVCLGLSLILSA